MSLKGCGDCEEGFQVVTIESARADAESEIARFVERSCGDLSVQSSLSPEEVRRRIVDDKRPSLGRRWACSRARAMSEGTNRSMASIAVRAVKRVWASRRTIVFVAQAAVVAVRVTGVLCAVAEVAIGTPRPVFMS